MNMRGRRTGAIRLFTVVATMAILAGGMPPGFARAATDLGVGDTGTIANANGDRVRLRAKPGADGEVLLLLTEGATLLLESGPEAGPDGSLWYQVIARDGTAGYVAADFVEAGTDDGWVAPEPVFSSTTDEVNLRAGPSLDDVVLETLAAGTTVSISGESLDGWFAVSIEQKMGFIHGDYLTEASPAVDAKAGPGTRYTLERLRLRTGPSTGYRTIVVLPVGTRLDFTGEVQGSWAKVSSSQGTGWVAAQYIGPRSPSGSSGASGGTRYTTDAVHLRTGPGTGNRSMAVLRPGTALSLTGSEESGFIRVSTAAGTGWVSAQYTSSSAPSSGERGFTNDRVSFRTGPGSGYGRITMLAVGTPLTLTGRTESGYSRVTASAGTGWVASSYISSVAPQYTGGTRYTTDSVNLRRSASTGGSVIAVVPARTAITFTGTVVNNYGKVATSFGDGWISIDYFRKTQPSSPSSPSSSQIVWPVKGGEWYVSQGYNGSSHQNNSSSWQYYYSFDLKRTSGSTAGQAVYSPVDGRIRWIDESTGGMSIYMGNGLAFAMFHVLWASGIREGQAVRQGQYLGVIAPAGVANSGSSAHIHITAWTTADEGNWSRRAQPFTGRFAIEGASFPARGTRNDYLNYRFNP